MSTVLVFSTEVCHTILAGNMSSELSCIDNVREHIQTQTPPVLTHLLNRYCITKYLWNLLAMNAPTIVLHVNLYFSIIWDLCPTEIKKKKTVCILHTLSFSLKAKTWFFYWNMWIFIVIICIKWSKSWQDLYMPTYKDSCNWLDILVYISAASLWMCH